MGDDKYRVLRNGFLYSGCPFATSCDLRVNFHYIVKKNITSEFFFSNHPDWLQQHYYFNNHIIFLGDNNSWQIHSLSLNNQSYIWHLRFTLEQCKINALKKHTNINSHKSTVCVCNWLIPATILFLVVGGATSLPNLTPTGTHQDRLHTSVREHCTNSLLACGKLCHHTTIRTPHVLNILNKKHI